MVFFLGWFGGRTILGQPHFVSLRSRRLANWTLVSHRIRWRQSQRWGAVGREGYDSQRNAKKHTPKREQNTKVLLFFLVLRCVTIYWKGTSNPANNDVGIVQKCLRGWVSGLGHHQGSKGKNDSLREWDYQSKWYISYINVIQTYVCIYMYTEL